MTAGENDTWADPFDRDIEAAADRILSFPGTVDRGTVTDIDRDAAEIAWIERPDQLDEPKLAFLLQHWQSLADQAGGIPERSELDVLDLVPAIGNLVMLEAERDGFDAVYRVYGTGVADRAGRDWTGYRVSEMNRITRTPAALLYRSCYRAVSRRAAPLYSEHASAKWLGVCTWRRLILPLSQDGVACARYLVGNLPVGQRVLSKQEVEEQQRRIRSG